MHSDDEEDEMLPQPEGDADEGYSYDGNDGGSSIPLVAKKATDEGEVVFDGDEELLNNGFGNGDSGAESGQTELVPYAHRDLKPG